MFLVLLQLLSLVVANVAVRVVIVLFVDDHTGVVVVTGFYVLFIVFVMMFVLVAATLRVVLIAAVERSICDSSLSVSPSRWFVASSS